MIEPMISVKFDDEKGMDALRAAIKTAILDAPKETDLNTIPATLNHEFYVRCTENAKDLLAKLKYVNQIIPNDPMIPILGNVFFDNGTLIGSDLQTTVGIRTDIKGRFLVSCKQLMKILSFLDKHETVSFIPGKGFVEVYINGVKAYKLDQSDYIDDYPTAPVCEEEHGMLTTKDFNNIVNVLKFTSNDDLRLAMTGVYVHDQIVATNGHMLAWHPVQGQIIHGFIVPNKSVNLLKGFTDSVVHAKNNTNFKFSNTDKWVVFKAIDERFFDYMNVIPDFKYATVKFEMPIKSLEKILKMALLAANSTTHQVRIDISANKITFSAEDLDYDNQFEKEENIPVELITIKEPIMNDDNSEQVVTMSGVPMFEEYKPFDAIGVNGKKLLDAIGKINDTKVRFQMFAANKAMILNDSMLVMPTILNKKI
jgi:DNA polymerase III sliding clamp (beta) subunit (PCNA family)